ncbi:hypothetical protein ACWEPC_09905 [Nonomuraea sp. NPDC004297]
MPARQAPGEAVIARGAAAPAATAGGGWAVAVSGPSGSDSAVSPVSRHTTATAGRPIRMRRFSGRA